MRRMRRLGRMMRAEYNSPGTSGDDGPGALEPNDDEEETAADPA